MNTLPTFRFLTLASALVFPMALPTGTAWAQGPLANQPVLTAASVPGNLALALSVEFPTAVSVAHIGTTYSSTTEYVGYFDPNKCYLYNFSTTEADRHFYPTSITANRQCSSASQQWSGNFLNWATMQTIDPFRWALTGGYRVVDTPGGGSPGVTIIEKAWASGQGGTGNFPNRSLTANVGQSTPFTFSPFRMRVQGLGNKLRFTNTGNVDNAPTAYNPASPVAAGTTYEVSVRVKVCDAAIGLEANCVAYGSSPVTYKPEGLLQKYAERIRYSAFGYLNDNAITRDGGVLRARQAFIGPMQPVPSAPSIPNPIPEWNGTTGVMIKDPVTADSSAMLGAFGVTVNNSGVMNYLNKFGQITPGSYKTYDPVGELYYAAVRYFKNLANVPEWTNMGAASVPTKTTYIDGFPVITNWDDPILYSCQKNFILGIGDVNTHADKNVPGSSAGGANEPAKPTSLALDPVLATTMTNKLGVIEGVGGGSLGTVNPYNGCCNNNSALMSGIAYDSNTNDIRPDVLAIPRTIGKQTIQTYWLDVLEYSTYKNNNQFYLATKYGGFKVPAGFDPNTATALPSLASWHTTGRTSPTGQLLPDNYFIASDPKSMVNGLAQAFASIAAAIQQTTTSSATAQPQVLTTGSASYSAAYDSTDWSGDVIASNRLFGSTATPVDYWKFSAELATQLTGSGWQAPVDGGNRIMATWNGTAGIPFQYGSLTAAQKAALDTPWISGDDSLNFWKYLRGDKTNETTTPNYRPRAKMVGDIVDSTLLAVRRPNFNYSEYFNPGYPAFKSAWQNRRTMLYVGTNAGVLHAINGATHKTGTVGEVDSNAGREVFSYVPSALFSGPSVPATPDIDGLAALGNPAYVHRNYVNSSPDNFDVDLSNTVKGKSASPGQCKNPDNVSTSYWRTMLIGGLGKGGKSYYALDITDPLQTDLTSPGLNETKLAAKVMWEFPHATDVITHGLSTKMGFSYGAPVVVKTAQHGWVVIFTSGYNNTDGKGYFFVVDACTGLMVQPPIATGVGSPTNEAGMAHPTSLVLDYENGLADAAYAGDMLGNVWRLDMRATTGNFPAPERIAVLKDVLGAIQPVTSRPLVEICPKTRARFVMVGTGRLLDVTDASNIQKQTYYGFKDGNDVVFDTTLGSGNSVVRADLVDITDDLMTATAVFTNQKGWLIEVGKNEPELGWRVVTNSTFFNGNVVFAASLPDSSNACASQGYGLFYGFSICTGKSALRTGTTLRAAVRVPKLPNRDAATIVNAGGKPLVGPADAGEGCDEGGVTCELPTNLANPERLLNWREVDLKQ